MGEIDLSESKSQLTEENKAPSVMSKLVEEKEDSESDSEDEGNQNVFYKPSELIVSCNRFNLFRLVWAEKCHKKVA